MGENTYSEFTVDKFFFILAIRITRMGKGIMIWIAFYLSQAKCAKQTNVCF